MDPWSRLPAVTKILVLCAFTPLLLAGCSGEKGPSPGAPSSSLLAYFPGSTRFLLGLPAPSRLVRAAGEGAWAGLTGAVLDQWRPGGFGPLEGPILEPALEAWRALEKRGAAPGSAWLGGEGEAGLSRGVLVLDFHGKGKGKARAFPEAWRELYAGKGGGPGGWTLSLRREEGRAVFLLKKGKKVLRLEGAPLGEAYVLAFGPPGSLDRSRAAWAGKAPSLQGRSWAARVKSWVAEGWPSWGRAPGGGARPVPLSLPVRAGLPPGGAVLERWSPGDGENLLEISYGEDSGYPWKLARLSVDPDAFAALLPADTEAFLLGSWNTEWMKRRLFPLVEGLGGDVGWLRSVLEGAKRILGVWKEGSIRYEMVSKEMFSLGVALRPSGEGGKADILVAFGVPREKESWVLGWVERGYRTVIFPKKAWWGKTDYLIYERKADPLMAATTGKGRLFFSATRKSLIGFLEAAEGRTARLADAGPYRAFRLTHKDPADLFFYVAPGSPLGPWRLLPGRPEKVPAAGPGPFGGGIFLKKGRLVFSCDWPLSPWNLAMRRLFLGE